MNFKGMPIYGVVNRPHEGLTDAQLAEARAAALKGNDMAKIVALNTETQLRKLLGQGAKLMPTPKAPGRRKGRR